MGWRAGQLAGQASRASKRGKASGKQAVSSERGQAGKEGSQEGKEGRERPVHPPLLRALLFHQGLVVDAPRGQIVKNHINN